MADKKLGVEISTRADVKGAKAAEKSLDNVKSAAKGADKSIEDISGDKFAASIKQAKAELEKARQVLNSFKTEGIDVSVASAGLDVLESDLNTLDPKLDTFEKDLVGAAQALKGLKVGKIDTKGLEEAEKNLLELEKQIERTQRASLKGIKIGAADENIRKLQVRLKRLQDQLVKTEQGTKEFRRLSNEINKVGRELRLAEGRKLKITEDAAKNTRTLNEVENSLQKVNNELNRTSIGSKRFKSLQKEARTLNRELDKGRVASGFLAEGLGRLPGGLGNVAAGFASGGKQAGAMAAGITAVVGAVASLRSGLASAANTQQLEVSFETLLGSIDAAKGRIAELKDFSARTPFELPAIARASKILETLTKGALATGEGLETVGNLAASTGEGFDALAIHVGRLYDGLNNGRPVGESLLRLQELGIVSAATRSQIELLQKEGKKGEEVWGVAANSFGRFAGEMEKQSKTLKGAFSTLSDGIRQALGSASRPTADALAASIRRLNVQLGFAEESVEDFSNTAIPGLGRVSRSVEELEQAYWDSRNASNAAKQSAEDFTTGLIDGFVKATDAARGLNAEQEALAREELSLELAEIDAAAIKNLQKKLQEIDASALTESGKEAAKAQAAAQNELEKEQAKIDAKRRAASASAIREQKALREEIKQTSSLRNELAELEAKEASKLAELQGQNEIDINIGDLGPALNDARKTLLVEGRRIRALQAELANPITQVTPGKKREAEESLETSQQKVAAANLDIARGKQRATELNLPESSLTPEAIEQARTRLEQFAEAELAQKQLLESIAEKLTELDDSGAIQDLERKLENNAKIQETRTKRVAIEASTRLASIQDKSDKVREDSQAKAIEAAAKATKERREKASGQIEKALEQLKEAAEERGLDDISSEIDGALSELDVGSTDALKGFLEKLKRNTDKEAALRLRVIKDNLGELEKEPEAVEFPLPQVAQPSVEPTAPETQTPQQTAQVTPTPTEQPAEQPALQPVAERASALVASSGQLEGQIVSSYEQVIAGQEQATAQLVGLSRELAGVIASTNSQVGQLAQDVGTLREQVKRGRA
jgi:hypothetical protein